MSLTQSKTKPLKQKKGKSIVSKTISFLHLWLGLAAGGVLIVVAITGCILSFEDEISSVVFSKEQRIIPGNKPLPIDSLVSIAKAGYPEKKIFRMIVSNAPEHSVKATFGTKKTGYDFLYLNPYTGAILSKGKESKRFFAIVLNLHRFLLAGTIGKTITGISCAITFFMALSGMYLWWPKNKKVLKQRLVMKSAASFKRTNWDLHAVGGFYSMIFLVIITLTGLIWSYDAVENLLLTAIDGKVTTSPVVKQGAEKAMQIEHLYAGIVAKTDSIYPYQGNITISFPDKKNKPVLVSKENESKLISTVNQIYFDNRNGKIIDERPFSSLTTGSQIRKLNKAIHTGSILGWPTKVLMFIVSLLTASLPITGLLIYLGRGKKTIKRV
ncbi:PepSY-associated TM helix domain-containing protein [Pedobacter frigidisoli]|uniref:PepSY-associated TM helix domain-containing protein n=1 Tax=Pedobacter frigidisoli TaxID=2530455 RepID=UPI00292E510C|nr:PepSY-associated TM helix domain-containing protein [Pedobacter frigidisoli]